MMKVIICCTLGIYMLAISIMVGVAIIIDIRNERKNKGGDEIVGDS